MTPKGRDALLKAGRGVVQGVTTQESLDEPAVNKEHRGGRFRQRDGEGHDEDDMADGDDLGRLTHQDAQAPPPQGTPGPGPT